LISRSLNLFIFLISFVLTSNHLVWLYRSVGKFYYYYYYYYFGQDVQNARQRWESRNHFGNLGEAWTIIIKRYKFAKFKCMLKYEHITNGAAGRARLIPIKYTVALMEHQFVVTHRYTI
jgi:hypothetical protein